MSLLSRLWLPFLRPCLGLVGLLALSLSVRGQGTILFSSSAMPEKPRIGVVWAAGGVTRAVYPGGPGSRVEILAKASGSPSYAPVLRVNDDGTLSPFLPIQFLTGRYAGLFSGGVVVVPGVPGGTPASVLIRYWDANTGPTFEAATIKGVVAEFGIDSLGGAGMPPSLPAVMSAYRGGLSSTGGTTNEPALAGPVVVGDRLRFSFHVVPWTTVETQFSEDLVHWVPLGASGVPGSWGTLEAPMVSTSGSGFFRAIYHGFFQ